MVSPYIVSLTHLSRHRYLSDTIFLIGKNSAPAEPVSFNPPKSELDLTDLKPAPVEIVSRPNLSIDFATFRQGNYVALIDYVPGTGGCPKSRA